MKRVVDVLVSALLLLLLAPVMLLIAWLVRRRLGTPVLFSQARGGRHGTTFRLLKFRSMTSATDASGNLLPDHQRLPAFGRRLRASSLDELPSLWNVLRGDMSLVGPRPLLVDYLPLYSPQQARRHEVRPGITGWAQVNGRNALAWERKFELDVWYVDHRSLWLDLKILGLTLVKVFTRDGIAAEDSATMPRFSGSTGARPVAEPARLRHSTTAASDEAVD